MKLVRPLKCFRKEFKMKKVICISSIRLYHGGEFENHIFKKFCNENDISHNFSSPKTPQQNMVIKRKNKYLQEMARTMLLESGLSKGFWAEAVNTACYIQNCVFLGSIIKKTFELSKGSKPNISYFHIFGFECFILNSKDKLSKFNPKANPGIFLRYSSVSKAYRMYNKRTRIVGRQYTYLSKRRRRI